MTHRSPFTSAELTNPVRRTPWRRLLWIGLGAIILVVAGTGYFLLAQGEASGSSDEASGPATTFEVTRQSISDTRSFSGTLGHGEAMTVTSAGQGVITGIAEQGTPIEPGTELYRVNEHPVIAMYGEVPMYRELRGGGEEPDQQEPGPTGDQDSNSSEDEPPQNGEGGNGEGAEPQDPAEGESEESEQQESTEEGAEESDPQDAPEEDVEEIDLMSGADVAQLIDNLTVLGYADCESIDEFTKCVENAVRSWQADLGVPETGIVSPEDIVFVPEGGRVDTFHTRVGNAVNPGTPILDITGLDLVVSLELPVRDRDLLAADTGVDVRLPGGAEVTGSVTSANVVAAESGGAGGGSNSSSDTIAVAEVTLDEVVDSSLLGAPADVLVEVDERSDVLVVPISALVAMTGGGHGLEVVAADGTTSMVPVETGLFAGGLVEVTGEGIDEGTVVGVAGR